MVYYPFVPVTWVSKFIEGARRNQDTMFSNDVLREFGILRPAVLKRAFKLLNLLDDSNKLTDLGKKLINFQTRSEACKVIVNSIPYDELTYKINIGEISTLGQLKNFIRGITGFKKDPVDKVSALYLFFLKLADFENLRDINFIKKAQTNPKSGTRTGKKNKNHVEIQDNNETTNL